MEKIAKNIISSLFTVRDLLKRSMNIIVINDYDDNSEIMFQGPVELTVDGIARWGHILDKQVMIDEGRALVLDIQDNNECDDLCALFNTINGRVNKYTYKKYIGEN